MTDVKLNCLSWITINCVQTNELSIVLKCSQQNFCLQKLHVWFMSKEDMVLNNLQWLICHKTQPNQIIYF